VPQDSDLFPGETQPTVVVLARVHRPSTQTDGVKTGGTNSLNPIVAGAPMDALRFGRKVRLPSTIAIKHQVRMLMAGDEAKKTAAKARARSTDIPQINVGPERLTT
jgi:hypothetical protein